MAMLPRSSNRRDQLIAEATALFASRGFRGTSIREVARACSISEAAVYRHFKGKADMYEAVIRRKAEAHDIESHLAALTGQLHIEDVLRGMAEHILSFLDTDPELLGLMFTNSRDHSPCSAMLFKKVRMPYINFLAQEIEKRKATGEVRDVDPMITARCFVGMVMDCALSVDSWNRVIEFDFHAADVVANNVPIFARGLVEHQPEEKPKR
jgi:AcrR family transcriptional regulator